MGDFGLGALGKAGLKFHANAWDSTNTGVAVGAGDMLDLIPAGIPRIKAGTDKNNAIHGVGLQKSDQLATKAWQGPIQVYLGYNNNVQRLFASLFGTEATSILTASQSFSHLLTWNEENDGIHFNFAATDNLVGRDVAHCKVETIQVVIEEGKIGMLTAGLLGKQELIDDSGANTFANLNTNLALPTVQPPNEYLMLPEVAVRINAHSAGALGSGDLKYPSKLTLNWARQYKRRRTTQTGRFIAEPKGGAFRLIGGILEFTEWTSTTDWTWLEEVTELKADFTVTSPDDIGASTDKWQHLYEYPLIQLLGDPPDLNDPDLLKVTFPFECKEASSAPTGMTRTGPSVTIQDDASGDHLNNGV